MSQPTLFLRPARPEDEERLLEWRNLDWVVELGDSQSKVTADEHQEWFEETLSGDHRQLFLIEIDHEPQGMLRFDELDDHRAEVSIYLMPDYQGRGLGRRAFHQALGWVHKNTSWNRLVANVRPDNVHSQTYFERLGFERSDDDPDLIKYGYRIEEISHSRPYLTGDEAETLQGALDRRQLAQGELVNRVEEQWADESGLSHAAAVGSGLGALRLALLALDVSQGDEVIIPAYSCVALLNAPLSLGARPVLADVKSDDWTLDPSDVAARMNDNTAAIVAVNLFGVPAPVEELKRFGVPVIEDCAHGIGKVGETLRLGSRGDINIGSFYATKFLAGGEGGIIASDDPNYIKEARRARSYSDQLPDGRHLNDKMSDLSAGVALNQLNHLQEITNRRRERAERYHRKLSQLSLNSHLRIPRLDRERVWYRYVLELDQEPADNICDWSSNRGVQIKKPVWDLSDSEYWTEDLVNSRQAFDRVISLPIYPDLKEREQDRVIELLYRRLERFNDKNS